MSMLDRIVRVPPRAPALDRLLTEIERRPLLPLVAVGIVLVGLALVVALTISAGAHSDNFGQGPAATLQAVTFRPWFRIALLAGTGIALAGIIVMLLAIIARIRWLTFAQQRFLPVAIDVRRAKEGRAPHFLARSAGRDGDE
ncbi:MAG: hypothetical protein V3V06_05940 [Dehalococcoidia bacterium]